MQLVDTHCHLDFIRFDEDRADVIRRAREAGVLRIVVPGLDLATSTAICDLAEHYPDIYAAVGIHPNDLEHAGEPEATLSAVRRLAAHDKVVAIGEIGLDYYWKKTPPEVQQEWLHRQLMLASDLALPVILHNRESIDDLLTILTRWVNTGLPQSLLSRPGVVHSFSGTWSEAQRVLDLGFYLGFTGPLTYKNAEDVRTVAANAPADRILVETDSPFLPPVPHRGNRNEPAFVWHIAEKLAEVRGISLDAAAEMTTQNASRLFIWEMAAKST
jgi:TatD DNase family protein